MPATAPVTTSTVTASATVIESTDARSRPVGVGAALAFGYGPYAAPPAGTVTVICVLCACSAWPSGSDVAVVGGSGWTVAGSG